MSAIASVVKSDSPEDAATILDEIPDPVGALYRYGLPASFMFGRTEAKPNGDDGIEGA